MKGRKQKLILCFGILFFCTVSICSGKTLIVNDSTPSLLIGKDVQFIEDKSKDLVISDILSKPESAWTHYKKSTVNFGYTNSAYWIKLSLKNDQDKHFQRVIEIGYPVLDYLDAYLFSNNKIQQSYSTGDKYPFSSRLIEHRNFLFPISFEPHAKIDIYFRVQTTSSMQIPILLQTEYKFMVKSQKQILFLGLYYGTMFVMALYNLFVFISVREKIYLYYVIYVSAMCLFLASLNGISYQFLWPVSIWWNDQSIIVSLAAVILFALLFSRSFLDLPGSHIKIDKIARFLIIYSAVFFVIAFFLQYKYAIVIVISNAVIMIFLAFFTGILRWRENYPAAKYFTTAWIAMLSGGLILAFNKLGVISRNGFTENAVQIGSAIEVILLSFALADRLNFEKKERFEAQKVSLENERLANVAQKKALTHLKEAREAQELALTIQKKANETLERNVYLRTIELEEANTKLTKLSITDGLTGLYNRRHFNEIYNNEFVRSLRDKTPLSFLIIDIDHFKIFNDEYGHIVGDDCLKTVSSSIKTQLLRDSDFIARYGGEEFCILLPNTPVEGAMLVAENIRGNIEEISFNVVGKDVPITVSIGVAVEIPENKQDSNKLLSMADKALYRSKENGRNRITLYEE